MLCVLEREREHLYRSKAVTDDSFLFYFIVFEKQYIMSTATTILPETTTTTTAIAPQGPPPPLHAASCSPRPSLVHVLMIPPASNTNDNNDDTVTTATTAFILDPPRWLERDYISKRYRAFQQAGIPLEDVKAPPDTTTTVTPLWLWKGVSNLERLLVVECCERITLEGEHDEHYHSNSNHSNHYHHNYYHSSLSPPVATGALDPNKVLSFVRLVARYGQEFSVRVLALAILERSLEEDQLDQKEHEEEEEKLLLQAATRNHPPEMTKSLPVKNTATTTTERPRKRQRRAGADKEPDNALQENDDDDNNNDNDSSFSSEENTNIQSIDAVVGSHNDDDKKLHHLQGGRVRKFLAAGGLSILSQWLIDASTPVHLPPTPAYTPSSKTSSAKTRTTTSKTGKDQQPTTKASPTGFLLLELIRFLMKIPFDRQLVTSSKINKPIRNLSKQMDELIEKHQKDEVTPSYLRTMTDPRSGGLPIVAVKEALDELKSMWAEQFKQTGSASTTKEQELDPFAAVKQALGERLASLKVYNNGAAGGDKPEWIAKVEAAVQRAREKKAPKKAAAAAAAKPSNEQLDRREREHEREFWMRRDLQEARNERLRLVKQYRELKQSRELEERRNQVTRSEPKRRVRWKDGHGAASRMRNRETLEEVFVFTKEPKDVGVENSLVETDDDLLSDNISSSEADENGFGDQDQDQGPLL